jgi:transposase-like protein
MLAIIGRRCSLNTQRCGIARHWACVEVVGRWTYRYRAIDEHGQVIGVLVSDCRDGAAAVVRVRSRGRISWP